MSKRGFGFSIQIFSNEHCLDLPIFFAHCFTNNVYPFFVNCVTKIPQVIYGSIFKTVDQFNFARDEFNYIFGRAGGYFEISCATTYFIFLLILFQFLDEAITFQCLNHSLLRIIKRQTMLIHFVIFRSTTTILVILIKQGQILNQMVPLLAKVFKITFFKVHNIFKNANP